MERQIITIMRKRNDLLEEFYHLNTEVVDKIEEISKDFIKNFYVRRELLLKIIDQCDNQISSLSMCNWDRFKFEAEYKADYVALSVQKKKLITSIIDQDLFIMSKMGMNFIERVS